MDRSPSRRLLAVLALCLALGPSCGANLAPRGEAKPAPYKFVLGPRDTISVQVWPDDEFSKTNITIDPDGLFAFPYVGTVKAAGRTPGELAGALTAKLKEFIRFPVVSVVVNEFKSNRIEVVGEVRAQGEYNFFEGMTVLDAIAEAQGFDRNSADLDDVRIIRGKLADPKVYGLDLYALTKGIPGETAVDLTLQPGDVVYVTETRLHWWKRKVGEVLGIFGG
ncbi:MAG TPA: polysaccharide biosynthesis/export family protein, partial [Planctomycetota bacterium]|nr:polysaccharide biosynthesis/export family protein [Planctomycetota bacterium]